MYRRVNRRESEKVYSDESSIIDDRWVVNWLNWSSLSRYMVAICRWSVSRLVLLTIERRKSSRPGRNSKRRNQSNQSKSPHHEQLSKISKPFAKWTCPTHMTIFPSFVEIPALQLSTNNITSLDQWCNHVRKGASLSLDVFEHLAISIRRSSLDVYSWTHSVDLRFNATHFKRTPSTDITGEEKRREKKRNAKVKRGEYLSFSSPPCYLST